MNELTQRLGISQPVAVGGTDPTADDLRNQTGDLGYVLVRFPETRGGTELGFWLDREAADLSAADFGNATGTVHVEGRMVLNGDPIRCIADIDLTALTGTGYVVPEEIAVVAE